MTLEYFYPGTPYSLEPTYGDLFTGYRISAGSVGSSTGIQTANQIQDVANYLNQGMKVIEVGSISPEVFEMIPKQHLKEINRLTKLTGAEVSVHAPVIEPSGFTEQGWNEQNREMAERQLSDTVIRSHEMNPDGEMPVTMHSSSSIPGTTYLPIKLVKDLTPEEKEQYEKTGRVPSIMVAVNQETGEMTGLRREKRYYPGEEEKGRIFTPQAQLENANNTQWINKITNIAFYKKEADEVLARAEQPSQLARADLFLDNVTMSFRNLYEQAAKFGDGETKKALAEISDKWKKFHDEAKEGKMSGAEYMSMKSGLLDYSLEHLKQAPAPGLFKPVEEFVIDKASETFANVALNAYKEFGKNAPIVSIENPPYGSAVSTAEDLKKLIEESRKKFVEKAVQKGYGEGEARGMAEKMIGATWDTSHISMMRRQGFKPEELVEEAKRIAPFVKHVHLNDNFGHTHTDLPPGMGNVPMGEIMKEFEKEGFKGKKIFEGGQFFQHFKTPPHAMVLEAMGSPIYSVVAQPSWNQARMTYGNYYAGYGTFLPEQHFSIYGAGFSSLPTELGGQVPGRQARMGGAPME